MRRQHRKKLHRPSILLLVVVLLQGWFVGLPGSGGVLARNLAEPARSPLSHHNSQEQQENKAAHEETGAKEGCGRCFQQQSQSPSMRPCLRKWRTSRHWAEVRYHPASSERQLVVHSNVRARQRVGLQGNLLIDERAAHLMPLRC